MRRAWGYGYATEAAQAVKSWCHEERGIECLVSLIAPDNVRSQRCPGAGGARSMRHAFATVSRDRSGEPDARLGHVAQCTLREGKVGG
jgi:hypothetical protein